MKNSVIEDQLIEARVAEIREKRDHGFDVRAALGDTEVEGVAALPPRLTSTEGGDRVTVLSKIDGEPRPIPSNMLAKSLKKRLPDGRRAFEFVDPESGVATGVVPQYKLGEVPCWFNPKSPRFEQLQGIPGITGFTCASEHLASEFDAEMHAKNRHGRRYGVAQDYLARQARDEAMDLQRRQVEAMLKLAESRSGGESSAAPATIFYCEADGCPRFFDNANARNMHVSRDHKGGEA